jgi:CRISPR/Cas system endoribonuclease Cas6 (RAMP superfamily)
MLIFTSVPALWVLGLLFILPVVASSYELVNAFTNLYGANMHLNMSFSNFTFVCVTFSRVFNEEILPNVFASIGIISNIIDGCNISS